MALKCHLCHLCTEIVYQKINTRAFDLSEAEPLESRFFFDSSSRNLQFVVDLLLPVYSVVGLIDQLCGNNIINN